MNLWAERAIARIQMRKNAAKEVSQNMRNILMTVMLLVVVIILFNNIIANDTTGTSKQIQTQGSSANTKIGSMLSTGSN
ncbi:hypothetical protein [Paenibacillus sp. BK720]|nr:hypothetical protein [Paenibacillus sp. BK720]NIK72385.1 hypothetical protein [Paenibacillus sp. BK720]